MTTLLPLLVLLPLLQTAPPATEVFLAPLTVTAGKVSVGPPVNISSSPGYDNQPFFSPDGLTLFFTSARGDGASRCGTPPTDIYKYEIAARSVSRVTDTNDCEYSPTVTPDGRHLSVIQVEPGGTQRLWRFTIAGSSPSVVLPDVKPVGYHAWLNETTLALFVLGEPATLQVADITKGTAQVVARDIGQSLVRIPDGGVSFVQQAGEGSSRTLTISRVTLENGRPVVTPLTPAPEGSRQAHLAWTPDGTLLTAHDGSLHAWRADAPSWRVVADLDALGLRNVTRLSVSPTGDRIAIVAIPQGQR